MSRLHWLPEVAWMGVVIGEWPLYAWPNKELAARWAAENTERRRVWPVEIPANVPVSRGVQIPASVDLEGVER